MTALENAAEQFVAWHKDGHDALASGMLDYFAEIFGSALASLPDSAGEAGPEEDVDMLRVADRIDPRTHGDRKPDGLVLGVAADMIRDAARREYAVASQQIAEPEPTDERIRKVYKDACEHADECQQGFSYGRMQALRAVFDLGRATTHPAPHPVGSLTDEQIGAALDSIKPAWWDVSSGDTVKFARAVLALAAAPAPADNYGDFAKLEAEFPPSEADRAWAKKALSALPEAVKDAPAGLSAEFFTKYAQGTPAVKGYHPGVSGEAFGLVCVTDDRGGFSGELTAYGREVMAEGAKVRVYFHGFRDAAPSQPPATPAVAVQAEPVAWESTTVCYTRFVTQSRYEKFSDKVQRWYKPYRCSACAHPKPAAPATAGLHEQLAKLGWQAIECELCGSSARAFPQPPATTEDAVSDRIRSLVQNLADQQERPDDWWKVELEAILALRSGASAQPADGGATNG